MKLCSVGKRGRRKQLFEGEAPIIASSAGAPPRPANSDGTSSNCLQHECGEREKRNGRKGIGERSVTQSFV